MNDIMIAISCGYFNWKAIIFIVSTRENGGKERSLFLNDGTILRIYNSCRAKQPPVICRQVIDVSGEELEDSDSLFCQGPAA